MSKRSLEEGSTAWIQRRLLEREQARSARNFSEGDRIRDELQQQYGVTVNDHTRVWTAEDGRTGTRPNAHDQLDDEEFDRPPPARRPTRTPAAMAFKESFNLTSSAPLMPDLVQQNSFGGLASSATPTNDWIQQRLQLRMVLLAQADRIKDVRDYTCCLSYSSHHLLHVGVVRADLF